MEIFECRAACSKISNEKKKIQWCKSVIGGVGRRILKGLTEGSRWEDAKQELRRFLGEVYSRAAAWKKLRGYQAKGKCYREIASEVRELAVRAADEEDVRVRLAAEAFLGANPWPFAKEIRMKKMETLEEALDEARTRRALEAEEEGRRMSVHAAVEGETMTEQGQDVVPRRDRRTRRDPVCWGCGELGMCLGSARCGAISRSIGEGGEKVMSGGLRTLV